MCPNLVISRLQFNDIGNFVIWEIPITHPKTPGAMLITTISVHRKSAKVIDMLEDEVANDDFGGQCIHEADWPDLLMRFAVFVNLCSIDKHARNYTHRRRFTTHFNTSLHNARRRRQLMEKRPTERTSTKGVYPLWPDDIKWFRRRCNATSTSPIASTDRYVKMHWLRSMSGLKSTKKAPIITRFMNGLFSQTHTIYRLRNGRRISIRLEIVWLFSVVSS